ncbi:MAG: hypothetical protein V1857_06550 [archaeon]
MSERRRSSTKCTLELAQKITCKELLLGDNPFIGVSHLTQEAARKESSQATLDNILRVMQAAHKSGATGFTFSTHPRNLEVLTHVRHNNPNLLRELNYFILAPYAQTYVRRSNEEGTPAMAKSILRSVTARPSAAFELAGALLSRNVAGLVGAFVGSETMPFMRILPENRVSAILLHEVMTDLIVAFQLDGLLRGIGKYVKQKMGIPFGVETRNFGQLCAFLENTSYVPEFIMAPFNALGYQMAPNRLAAENALVRVSECSSVLAMNILASGALSLAEAIEYLSNHNRHLYGIVSATVNPARASQNFLSLKERFLSGTEHSIF